MARRLGSPGLAVASMVCALLLATSACDNPIAPKPIDNTPPPPDGAVLVGAGDIAQCGSPGAYNTAALLDAISGDVFTAGDNAYHAGRAADFRDCYEPTWGRHKNRTHPVLGNHEYIEGPPDGYFDYFGAAAGPRGKGYYMYTVGTWRVIALNSELLPSPEHATTQVAANDQLQWFKTELATNNVFCTIAIWHRPLYSSGKNGPTAEMRDLFKAAYDGSVDIVINGHDHNYERFAPQDADGRADSARGVRQFVVGTGGVSPYIENSKKPNQEAFLTNWGVLKLTLSPGTYSWDFISVTGAHDTGTGVCH